MVSNGLPAKKPVELKVKVAAIATYLGVGALLGIAQAFSDDPVLQGSLPTWLTPLLVPLLPGVITYLAAYRAAHTPRPDLAPAVPPVTPETPQSF